MTRRLRPFRWWGPATAGTARHRRCWAGQGACTQLPILMNIGDPMPTPFSEHEVLAFARHAYRAGSAAFAVEREHCALLVIDMQDEFVKPHWTPFWVPEATRQVPRIKRLIDACRADGVPVIYTAFARTHHYLDRPLTGPLMPNRYAEDDAVWFRHGTIWQDLTPLEEEIVLYKPSYGAFYDTPLATI